MIYLGDIGVVEGRRGVFIVTGGAAALECIRPVSASAIQAATPADDLELHGGSENIKITARRSMFRRLDKATPEQLEAAGVFF